MADVGFGPMWESAIIEAGISNFGVVGFRHGSIACEGSAVDTYARRAARCDRATPAVGATAVANNMELILRHRTASAEVATGESPGCRHMESDIFGATYPLFAVGRSRTTTSRPL